MTKEYYDQESAVYSHKRYRGAIDSYVKYFFRRRLALVASLVKQAVGSQTGLAALEIACADGVVLRELKHQLPGAFSKLVGIDIAPQMINVARQLSPDQSISYYVRGEEPVDQFDIILSIGYLAPPLFDSEFAYITKHLKPGGYYLCSQAGRWSIQARLKIKHQPYYRDYRSYRQVERRLSSEFNLISARSLGLYVPKLWFYPRLARLLQPIIDLFFSLGGPLTREFFHERVYLLQKRID